MNTVAALAAIVVVLGAIHLAAGVVVPLLVAVCLTIAFEPVARAVAARGWRPAITSVVTVAVIGAVLAIAALAAVGVVGDLLAQAPQHADAAERLRAGAVEWLNAHDLTRAAVRVEQMEGEAWLASVAAGSIELVAGLLSAIALVVLLTVFIQLEAPGFPARLRRALGAADRAAQAERTLAALTDIQRYLVVKIASGIAKALLVGLATWVLDIGYPLLWAGLAFVLNFLPVLGPLAAGVPPVLLALLARGPAGAVATGVALLVINVAVGAVLEPRVLGRVVGLSPLVVVLAVALWALVLGPVGAVLAVPLTMVCKLALEQHPDLSWFARLLEHREVPLPHVGARSAR